MTAPSTGGEVPPGAVESTRVAAARLRNRQRYQRRTGRFRPVMWLVLAVVVWGTFVSWPKPGLHGTRLVITLALIGYCIPTLYVATLRYPRTSRVRLMAPPIVAGLAGIVLARAQLDTVGALPVSSSVMIAFMSLDVLPALLIGGSLTVGVSIAVALAVPYPLNPIIATILLCSVLALTAYFLKRSEQNADRAELLLAELLDARDAEAAAVALAERGRIARDLHDVLAQSLSALAIQLEGARKIAERERVSPALTQLIARSGELTREGLSEARRAVGALRGDSQPIGDQLGVLVERCRNDLHLSIDMRAAGSPRPLSPEATLAFYRGAQEALTNAARYAGGSPVHIVLDYGEGCARLTVRDGGAAEGAVPGEWTGGGNGLRGMRERVERAGGSVRVGPCGQGWVVEMEVPG